MLLSQVECEKGRNIFYNTVDVFFLSSDINQLNILFLSVLSWKWVIAVDHFKWHCSKTLLWYTLSMCVHKHTDIFVYYKICCWDHQQLENLKDVTRMKFLFQWKDVKSMPGKHARRVHGVQSFETRDVENKYVPSTELRADLLSTAINLNYIGLSAKCSRFIREIVKAC